MTRKICLAVDGSLHSERAFNWYLDHLHRADDHVILVTCFEAPNLPYLSITSGMHVPIEAWTNAMQEK